MRIERIPLDVPTRAPGGRTAAYILGGDDALLVDPAATDERLENELDRIGHIAVTHHHPDHVGHVADIADAIDATVWCRYGRADDFEMATGIQSDRRFRDGTAISVGEESVRVLDTPGHAVEHVAFVFDESVVVGDLAVAEGSVVVGVPEGDMRAYLTSLRRLHAMDHNRLFPAHGPVVDEPRATCERLIRHRLDREQRVLTAVEEGNHSVSDILDVAYDKQLEGVRDLAEATLRAHLVKLRHEGRVRWDGSRAERRG